MPQDDRDRIDRTTPAEAVTHTAVVTALPLSQLGYSLVNDQRFGHFNIVRPLGRGGMGEVYEAEDADSGRRVALKLLRQSLGTDTDRARFLREGRLAASINHEHVVYVYGSEEIAGSPVIVMELAARGSLKDRVEAEGPLPAAKAVDAILQVIDGLEATASSGVLHRDVKPSNCFIGTDGGIKVGDFGLSISTQRPAESHLTIDGAVLGTPAFAPPEQVTGQPLDVRSDIYSTAATLYFLLTGRPPFVGDSVVQVIASVIKQEPESPAVLAPGVSPDLASIVLRGLYKDRVHRYQSYDDLRRALLPYSSQRLSPARVHSRILASLVDEALYSLPLLLAMPAAFAPSLDLLSRPAVARLIGVGGAGAIYFGLLEGIWGASAAKMLLGIRVVRVGQEPVGVPRAMLRAFLWSVAIFLVPLALGLWYEAATGERLGNGRAFTEIIAVALLFVTARRANGFAGLHDVLTGSRVVEQPAPPTRVALQLPQRHETIDPHAPRIGAYLVVETLGATDTGQLVLGYDDVLRRYVWIHRQAPGTPEVTAERRAIARPGRLRWLSGRRTTSESWDAFDAPAGIPFTALVREPRPWSLVRFLLYDVAVEVEEILAAHESVPVAMERMWVTQRGTAVLLDFAAPGAPTSVTPAMGVNTVIARTAFLALTGDARVATCAAAAAIAPLPLHASEFLSQLERVSVANLAALIAALHGLLGKPATLTRRRRLVHIAGVALPPIAIIALALAGSIRQGTFELSTFAAPVAGVLLMLAPASMFSAAFFRGGLMFQLLGIAISTREGREAPRMLAFSRAVVAGLPSLAFVAGVVFQIPWLAAVALVVTVSGIVSAVLTPDRGLHDRLLGTRLVRR